MIVTDAVKHNHRGVNMNALTQTATNQLTMSSREIADLVNSNHSDVKRSAKRLEADGLLTQPLAEFPFFHNGNEYSEFRFNKRDSLVLVARLSPAFTAAVVDRWQELESKVSKISLPDFSDPVAAARAWADAKEQEQMALANLEAEKPKIAFVDNFTNRESLQNASQVGQTMGMSAIKLNRALDEVGGIYNKSIKRGRVFCQSWIDKGFGKMVQNEVGYPQAMFTTSGVFRVTEIMTSEGL